MNKSLMKELAAVERIVDGLAAQRKPDVNKMTTIMPPGVDMTYLSVEAGVNTTGEKVQFCVSDHPNAAGYFLGWRETISLGGTPRRRDWVANKKREILVRGAERRAEKFPANCARAREARLASKAGLPVSPDTPAEQPPAVKSEPVKAMPKPAKPKTATKPKTIAKAKPAASRKPVRKK